MKSGLTIKNTHGICGHTLWLMLALLGCQQNYGSRLQISLRIPWKWFTGGGLASEALILAVFAETKDRKMEAIGHLHIAPTAVQRWTEGMRMAECNVLYAM
jgi:hypothetical protein